jgi:hypothetical protein
VDNYKLTIMILILFLKMGNGVVFNDDPPMWCDCEDGCQEKKGKNCCPGNHNQQLAYSKSRKLRVHILVEYIYKRFKIAYVFEGPPGYSYF